MAVVLHMDQRTAHGAVKEAHMWGGSGLPDLVLILSILLLLYVAARLGNDAPGPRGMP